MSHFDFCCVRAHRERTAARTGPKAIYPYYYYYLLTTNYYCARCALIFLYVFYRGFQLIVSRSPSPLCMCSRKSAHSAHRAVKSIDLNTLSVRGNAHNSFAVRAQLSFSA